MEIVLISATVAGQLGNVEGSELFYGPHGFEAQIGPLEEVKCELYNYHTLCLNLVIPVIKP